jgi:Tol biopolymer transport system component
MPVVSPDGRYLAGGTVDGKHLKIYDFDRRIWKELSPPHTIGFTEWSADGRYLYFDNGWSADPAIYRLRVADQKMEQILSLKNFRRVLWGYLPWFGLTPSGEPLLMHDIGSQEVYALDFESQ